MGEEVNAVRGLAKGHVNAAMTPDVATAPGLSDNILSTQLDVDSCNHFRDTTKKVLCVTCGHELARHDPEDGTCDAHAQVGVGVCQCGRVTHALDSHSRAEERGE